MYRLYDKDQYFESVRVDAERNPGPCRFQREAWVRQVSLSGVQRLEYRFLVTGPSGVERAALDPRAEHTVATEWGPKSEWRAPDYREPDWLDAPSVGGRINPIMLPSARSTPLRARVWSPSGLRRKTPAPLLWCHDGSAYAKYASLLQWAGSHIAAGALPPFRIVLHDPRDRMRMYSGNRAYEESFSLGLDAISQSYRISHPVAVMGASLGGVTALLCGLHDERVGVIFSQSGSFFDPDFGGWTPWAWSPRLVERVQQVKESRPTRFYLEIGMVCGRREDNYRNNESMVRSLERNGYHARLWPFEDLHNYTAWRDSLDPVLPALLRRRWVR